MNDVKTRSALCWYVVRTHPRQEDRAEDNLRAWSIETFAPRIKQRKYSPFTDEPFLAIKHLFPGYIFARLDLESLYHKIRFTRGVHSLVSFNNIPAPLDENIIEIIRSRIGHDGFVKLSEDFEPGDPVVIKDGAFKGFTGVFERNMKESDRVMILLNTVNYQAHVQIEKNLIKKPEHPLGS